MTTRRTLVLAVAFFAACGLTSQSTVPRPYPEPSADELLAALRARQAAVYAQNLETRTTSWLGGERLRAKVLILAERAGRLRFEAEVSLRGTVATLVTDRARFALAEMEANTFKRGPACPDNVASLVRIPLAPHEIAAILLGDAPIPEDARAVGLSWDGGCGCEVLDLKGQSNGAAANELRVRLRKTKTGVEVVGVEGKSPGQSGVWRVSYEDLETVGNERLPGLIRFAEPGRSFDDGVEIKVKDRRTNPTLPDAAFTLEPPPGFKIIELGCRAE